MAIVEDFAVGSGDGRELGRRLFVAGSAPYTSAQLSMIEPHGGLVHYFPDLMKLMVVPTSLTRQRAKHGSAGERLARLKLPTQLLKTRQHRRSRPSHVHCPIFLFGVTRSHGWWDASTRTDAPILVPPHPCPTWVPSLESN
ncbi:hypothetical protein BHM03_00001356 [Ensete ventricosum]|uniref:Uncharacterized protein n=1 Tax=Ensete ventricosum TaxID=4639 RepID=A0A445M957_ENSVE|nr:hypothetical protein BHM03_00001356 [Ensete ventricosum]